MNCGYDATHTYGSLYQWGRKYGQYYEAGTLALTDMNKADDTETNKDKFGKYNTTDYNWFSGSSAASVGTGVFLPTAGYRSCTNGNVASHEIGNYWCSSVNGSYARSLYFLIGATGTAYVYMDDNDRAHGFSVRCVQE